MDVDLFIIAVVVAAYVAFSAWRYYNRKCEECGGKVRLDRIKDSMGHNISKKVTISLWRGPRQNTNVYKCQDCGHELEERYRSWR
jgi:hypothetical protein